MPIFNASATELHRDRTSAKWRAHGDEVLPMWVAEMDCDVSPPVAEALHAAIDRGDLGYGGLNAPLAQAFSGFAEQRWGWSVNPDHVFATTDVGVALVDLMRRFMNPGDPIVINTPVYNAFFKYFKKVGVQPHDVPLLDVAHGGRLDLEGIDKAMASGTKVMLLCSPHNPTGTVHSRDELTQLAAIARKHGAVVLSDEIHAPLTHPGVEFVPYVMCGPDAEATGITLTSPSKSWNIAGLKCALTIVDPAKLPGVPLEPVAWDAGQLGIVAGIAAYTNGVQWLDELRAELAGNAQFLAELLTEHVPDVGYHVPSASYLAWLDLSRYGVDDDPSVMIRERSGVVLSGGPIFGPADSGVGAQHVRMNIGTSRDIIADGVKRLASVLTV